MEKEIKLKTMIQKVIALLITIVIIFILVGFDIMRFEIVHKNLLILIIVISLLLSAAILFYKHFIASKVSNYYLQLVDFFFILNLAYIVVQVFFILVFFPATVRQTSMSPTLVNEDEIIVFSLDKPERGKIVVVEVDKEINTLTYGVEDKELIVKRVIGAAGDYFFFDNNGILFLNGEEVDEKYLKDSFGNFFSNPLYNTKTKAFDLQDYAKIAGEKINPINGEYRIPEGYFFVMGDNRNSSIDSRELGLIHKSQIIGVVRYRKISLLKWEKVQ